MSKTRKVSIVILLTFCLMLSSVLAVGLTSPNKTVYAGSDFVTMFTDDLQASTLDTDKWTLSKEGTTAIAPGTVTFGSAEDFYSISDSLAGWSVLRYEPVTLAEGETAVLEFTVENPMGTKILPSFNAVEDYTDTTIKYPYGGVAALWANGHYPEALTYKDPDIDFMGNYGGTTIDNDSERMYTGNGSVPGKTLYDAWVPLTEGYNGANFNSTTKFRAEFAADGSSVLSYMNAESTVWSVVYVVEAGITGRTYDGAEDPWGNVGFIVDKNGTDITTKAFEEKEGVACYPAVAIRQFPDSADGSTDSETADIANLFGLNNVDLVAPHRVNVSNLSLAVLDAQGEEKSKDEDIESWQPYNSNEVELKAGEPGLIIDNAANDDYIIKKTALTAPTKEARVLYDISFDMYSELTEDGNGVVYLGATDTELTDAIKLYTKLNADGKVVLCVEGDEQTEYEMPDLEYATIRIRCEKDGTNTVYVNDERAFIFNKTIKGTYMGYGTNVNSGTAKLAISYVSIRRYNLLQGNGGDFVETFDDGKYNADNLYISMFYDAQFGLDFIDPQYTRLEDGKLVIDDSQKTRVATWQTYSDYELILTLSDFSDTTKSVWGIIGARASADGDPLAMDGAYAFQFQYAGDIAGTGNTPPTRISGGAPAAYDVKDPETGEVLYRETLNVYEHDYSKGNLVIKIVKQDTRAEIYIYVEGIDEEHPSYMNPCAVFENCYGAGHLDVGLLHSGAPSSMTIDSLSIKNLDNPKADNIATVDENNRIELSYEKPGGAEDPGDDPSDPGTNPGGDTGNDGGDEGGCNCNGSLASTSFMVVAIALSAAVLFIVVKKIIRREEK